MRSKNDPVISVVVPAYNEEKLIDQCLKSIYCQDFPGKYEVILVDNNSTDKTVKFAQRYPVKVVRETTKGVVFAKQRGLLSAKADIVAFLDADSQATPQWLSQISQTLADPAYIAVTGPYSNTDGPLFHKKYVDCFQAVNNVVYKIFNRNMYLAGGNFACRRNVIKLFGGFDTSIGPGSDEYGILAMLKKFGKINFNPKMKTYTSGRRAQNGLLDFVKQMVVGYGMNYLSSIIIGKAIFPPYNDIR